MSPEKKKICRGLQSLTSTEDTKNLSDVYKQSKEFRNALSGTLGIDISSHDDVFNSEKPANPALKIKEEVDPCNMPSPNAPSPSCSRELSKLTVRIGKGMTIMKRRTTRSGLEILPFVKKEEFDDCFSTMVNTETRPQASPKSSSNSVMKNKTETVSYKPVKVEQCDVDSNSLSHVGNPSDLAVSNGNSFPSPDEFTLEDSKPASSTKRIKEEEYDDHLSTVVYVDESPPPSVSRNSSADKMNMKRKITGFQSTEAVRLRNRLSCPRFSNEGIYGEPLSVDQSRSEGCTDAIDHSIVMDSSGENQNSKNEAKNDAASQDTNAISTHRIVKTEELDDNLSTVVHLDRSPLSSPEHSSKFEKNLDRYTKCNNDDFNDSHSPVANTSFPSEARNTTSTFNAAPMASTSQHEISESYNMEMGTAAPLHESNVPRDSGLTINLDVTANESRDSESNYNDAADSEEDCDSSGKRSHGLSAWESDTESGSAAADKDTEGGNNTGESGENIENTSAVYPKDTSKKDELRCLDCPAVFEAKKEFLQHIRSHNGYRRFECDICQKRFTLKCNLRVHKRLHTGVKPFKCSTCEKNFHQVGHFRAHERMHTGQLHFECVICEKRFNCNSKLLCHERVHTGARPFRCATCGKRFSLNGSLRRHKLVHTGEKPFNCATCGRRFSEKGNLRRHKLIHTDVNSDDIPDVQQQRLEQSSISTGTYS